MRTKTRLELEVLCGMRRLMVLLMGMASGLHCAPCSQAATLPDAGFAPSISWDEGDAVANLSWPTVAGKRYHLQRSTGIENWDTIAEIYAIGSTLSVGVYETPPAPGGGNGEEPAVVPQAYVITLFDNDRELLSLPGGRRVLFEASTITGLVPQVLSVYVPGEPGEPPTPVMALSIAREWDEAYALDPQLTESSLTGEDIGRKDLFLAALQIDQAGGGGGSGTAFNAHSTGGPGVFYRIGVEEPDTDNDKLPDWREFVIGTDAWKSDTDGDGVSDGDEDQYGSDTNDPNDYPQPDPESPEGEDFYEKHQYGRIILAGVASRLLLTETDETSSHLLPIQSGPSERTQAFRRNNTYHLNLAIKDNVIGQATLEITPLGSSAWKWWAQIGPDGVALNTGQQSGPESSATAQLLPINAITETLAMEPDDRTRRKIGIGEEVKVSLASPSDATVVWALKSGHGAIIKPIGYSSDAALFVASGQEGEVELEGTLTDYPGAKATVLFDVIATKTISFVMEGGAGITIDDAPPGIRMDIEAAWYFGPDDVCFYNVVGGETSAPPVRTGCFLDDPATNQEHAEWIGGPGGNLTGTVESGLGTRSEVNDSIGLGRWEPPAITRTGRFEWNIQWQYRVKDASGDGTPFVSVGQWMEVIAGQGLNGFTGTGGKGDITVP